MQVVMSVLLLVCSLDLKNSLIHDSYGTDAASSNLPVVMPGQKIRKIRLLSENTFFEDYSEWISETNSCVQDRERENDRKKVNV